MSAGPEIILQSTEVPCSHGEVLIVNPGDKWPAPYRGSRYTIRRMKKEDGTFQYRFCWTRQGGIHHRSIFKGLLRALREIRSDEVGGSIRITPWREVLCKKYDQTTSRWVPYYVGKLDGKIDFNGFNLDPDLEKGQLWHGFHFKHGETWSVWVRRGSGNHLYWSRQGIILRSIDEHPELVSAIREIRPRGGRCYFTEHGHIWMNLPKGEGSQAWEHRIHDMMKRDYRELGETHETLFDSIAERFDSTKTFPLYLGKIKDFDDGEPPRTYFEIIDFNKGTKGEDEDDEDGFSSQGWKRMRRDG